MTNHPTGADTHTDTATDTDILTDTATDASWWTAPCAPDALTGRLDTSETA